VATYGLFNSGFGTITRLRIHTHMWPGSAYLLDLWILHLDLWILHRMRLFLQVIFNGVRYLGLRRCQLPKGAFLDGFQLNDHLGMHGPPFRKRNVRLARAFSKIQLRH
jgi:hypothetical protein